MAMDITMTTKSQFGFQGAEQMEFLVEEESIAKASIEHHQAE